MVYIVQLFAGTIYWYSACVKCSNAKYICILYLYRIPGGCGVLVGSGGVLVGSGVVPEEYT